MAKVIAPFLIKGTIEDINFVITADGNNYARSKRERVLTSLEFKTNPIYDRIRNHGQEFGQCAKKSVVFRQLAAQFFNKSKDMSFAGRANKVLLEILKEDILHPLGLRTLEQGMKSPFINEILIGFEGNKQRSLSKVLKTTFRHNPEDRTVTITNFNALEQLDWPEDATHAHLAMATANWDFENNNFDTSYSEEICCKKASETQTLTLMNDKPQGNHLYLTYLYIGFAKQERRKYKLLHRRNNTVSIIACQSLTPLF